MQVPACGLGKGEFYVLKCTFLHRIIGTCELEKISEIVESNNKPSTVFFTTKLCPSVPYLECLTVLLEAAHVQRELWLQESFPLGCEKCCSGKLHLWEHPRSLYSLEVLLGTLLTWFNSSHSMRVAVGATFLLVPAVSFFSALCYYLVVRTFTPGVVSSAF